MAHIHIIGLCEGTDLDTGTMIGIRGGALSEDGLSPESLKGPLPVEPGRPGTRQERNALPPGLEALIRQSLDLLPDSYGWNVPDIPPYPSGPTNLLPELN
ncbi:MAG: hypothetical protein LJE91_08035 [Gammaproteobacteria bacterium]|jgi:hypothetical protein|nr:hypothetical protein [Gammaproteobacteria bacterium]